MIPFYSCSHRSAESKEHKPDPGPDLVCNGSNLHQTEFRPGSDPGQTWTRFKPSMTASLNEDRKKQLYHDMTQGREDIRDLTNDPNRQPQQDMVEFLKEAEDATRSFYATQAGAC